MTNAEAMSRYKRVFREAYNYMESAKGELERASLKPPEALDNAWDKVATNGADIMARWDDIFVVAILTAISDELYRCYFSCGGEC